MTDFVFAMDKVSAVKVAEFLFGVSEFLALPIEKNFDPTATVHFAAANVVLPVLLVIIYLSICYVGPKYLSNRKPFDLRLALAFWNALLCTFSFVGMCRTVRTAFI